MPADCIAEISMNYEKAGESWSTANSNHVEIDTSNGSITLNKGYSPTTKHHIRGKCGGVISAVITVGT